MSPRRRALPAGRWRHAQQRGFLGVTSRGGAPGWGLGSGAGTVGGGAHVGGVTGAPGRVPRDSPARRSGRRSPRVPVLVRPGGAVVLGCAGTGRTGIRLARCARSGRPGAAHRCAGTAPSASSVRRRAGAAVQRALQAVRACRHVRSRACEGATAAPAAWAVGCEGGQAVRRRGRPNGQFSRVSERVATRGRPRTCPRWSGRPSSRAR